MENSEMIEGMVREAWAWVVDTYQTDGLVGLILTIIVGGVIFGGMGWIFYAAAKANAEGMKRHDN